MYITPRQYETLRLVAKGLSNQEIADILMVKVPTIKAHVSALLREFNAPNRTKLVLLAKKQQFVK